jgi:tRNA(Ile)-lysidine synthase
VRGQAIPVLEARLGRNIRPTLARTADLLRADAALLDELAAQAAAEIVETVDQDERRLGAGALRATPGPVASRVVHRALMELGVVPQATHIQSVLDLVDRRPGSRVILPVALIARRDREYVRLLRPSPRG